LKPWRIFGAYRMSELILQCSSDFGFASSRIHDLCSEQVYKAKSIVIHACDLA
jgi:hypothetical protein